MAIHVQGNTDQVASMLAPALRDALRAKYEKIIDDLVEQARAELHEQVEPFVVHAVKTMFDSCYDNLVVKVDLASPENQDIQSQ